MSIQRISDNVLADNPKYKNIHTLDVSQNDPSQSKTTNFKQDYVVMIRKKLYYAITQNDDEKYLRVYQVNNFISLHTSHSTETRPATCSITIQGGERVICAEREEQDSMDWESWDAIMKGWLGMDNEGGSESGNLWRVGSEKWNLPNSKGIDFQNVLKAREAKYGWKFAEKADWEPMDEVYVFAKTRNPKYKTQTGDYQYFQIFFGYIDSVQKTYTAGAGQGLLINIQAKDVLKLLDLSRVTNTPAMLPGVYAGGGIDVMYNFPQDQTGCFAVFDDYLTDSKKNTSDATYASFTNVFAGKPPYEIITQLALDAGVPKKFLEKRIEKVERIPFVVKLKQNQNASDSLFNAELKTRLSVCKEAAEKLFLEFFADEEGNLVLKIPTYALGCNRLPNNNMGLPYNEGLIESLGSQIVTANTTNKTTTTSNTTKSVDSNTTSDVEKVTYIVKSGDTLRKIAKDILGDANKYTEIYAANKNIIKDPSKIYVGQKLTIYKHINNSKTAIKNIQEDNKKTLNNMLQTDTSYSVVNGKILARETDKNVPLIGPEFIESFTLIDSDSQIYNMYEIQIETNLYDMSTSVPMAVRRVVPNFDSIVRFGLRPAPAINTPLISNDVEAEIFGIMMINKSMANRISGSLQMIEDSSIRVGDPIRFHMYDETPYQPVDGFPDDSVFYVTGIERNISPNSVSRMTLSLKAGRMMGQESVFDLCIPLYKYYFEDPLITSSNASSSSINYKDYTLGPKMTDADIIKDAYGLTPKDGKQYTNALNAIKIYNKNNKDSKVVHVPLQSYIDEIINNKLTY